MNLTPTYHSKYAVAQGLALGFGKIVFHQPWIGVYLSTAILCGAICWALQAFVPPGWALLGGLLATFRLAFLSYWMNSYWGGSMAALGGALALGSVVRLFGAPQTGRHRALLASLFAISLLLLATSRPYEGLAFSIPLLVYFGYKLIHGVRQKEIDSPLDRAAYGRDRSSWVVAHGLLQPANHRQSAVIAASFERTHLLALSALPLARRLSRI